MGQSLTAAAPGHGLVMVLTCDAPPHFLPETDPHYHTHGGPGDCATYHGSDYIEMRARAAKDGWKRRGGLWLGPCCQIIGTIERPAK